MLFIQRFHIKQHGTCNRSGFNMAACRAASSPRAYWNIPHYSLCRQATVLTFNSCTKCVGSLIHDRTPDRHPVFWAWKRRWPHSWTWIWFKATLGVDVLGLFFGHSIHWCLSNQALADVRSTGAGINYPHCTNVSVSNNWHTSMDIICFIWISHYVHLSF